MKLYQDCQNNSVNKDKWHNLKNEIEEIEKEIDKLYGLTVGEIKTIENVH